MARPVFRRVKAEEDRRDQRRLVHLDRDRALVEAALRDPPRSTPLSEVPGPGVQLRLLRARQPPRRRGRRRADVPARPGRPARFEERARPADGEGASTFRVWLFQIARNVVANIRRGRRRHPIGPARGCGDRRRPELDIEARGEPAPRGRAAWAAVARLPAERRRALVLRFVEEMSTAEIAGILGRSEGAVRVLIHRGLRAVARDLGGRRW